MKGESWSYFASAMVLTSGKFYHGESPIYKRILSTADIIIMLYLLHFYDHLWIIYQVMDLYYSDVFIDMYQTMIIYCYRVSQGAALYCYSQFTSSFQHKIFFKSVYNIPICIVLALLEIEKLYQYLSYISDCYLNKPT